jgi:hypothetical protein
MQSHGRGRTWYVVRPLGPKWEVDFGAGSSPFCYASREEAEVVARSAARLHWEDRQEPAGARLDLPGEHPHVLATYGRGNGQASLRAG